MLHLNLPLYVCSGCVTVKPTPLELVYCYGIALYGKDVVQVHLCTLDLTEVLVFDYGVRYVNRLFSSSLF